MLLKFKRLCAFLAALVVAAGFVCTPMYASANVTVDGIALNVLPGNTQSNSPDYSFAWLDNVVIRDSTTAITTSRLVPHGEYPYSHTFDDFVKEVGQYSVLNLINEKTVADAYDQIVTVLYYSVTALGMTTDEETMKAYVQNYGITLPAVEDVDSNVKVAVVYAALKYNAVYVLYNKELSMPKGITLDNAVCVILAEITGTFLPSGVDNLTGFAVNSVKTYISQFETLPISKNPDNNEVFYWAKVVTAVTNDYDVPTVAYDKATTAQKEYVDYAYFATILNTVYQIKLSPIRLLVADRSEEKNAVEKLILETMLSEANVAYDSDDSAENLFKLACENGYFELDEEFYSDIFSYDLYVAEDCQKVWFTPFALAGQIGGNDGLVRIFLGDKEMKPNETTYYTLDSSKKNETIELRVVYGDEVETVTYKFKILRKDKSENTNSSQSSLVNDIQNMIGDVIPEGNEKASEIVNSVFSQIDSAFSTEATVTNENILTTYGAEATTTPGYQGSPNKVSDGVDFDYLGKLLSETYINSDDASKLISNFENGTVKEKESKNFVQRTVETIKKNPEITAVPTSIIALGGLAGYIWTKRKKGEPLLKNDSTDEKD